MIEDAGEFRLKYAEFILKLVGVNFHELEELQMWAVLDTMKRFYEDVEKLGEFKQLCSDVASTCVQSGKITGAMPAHLQPITLEEYKRKNGYA